jgi:hypothetical protein
MPYVALEPATRESRLAAAAARWHALAASRPDLEPAIAVQRQLVKLLVDLLDTLEHGSVPRLSLPPRYLAAKLDRGLPALAGERIPLPIPTLVPVLLRICDVLSDGGAGAAADHLSAVLRDESMDPASLLSASLARDRGAIRTGAVHRGLSPDLVWLVAELAISPFVCALQRPIMAAVSDPALAGALDNWALGHCPVCGSWPALAEVSSGQPVLRCSFCAFAWTLPAGACAYCGDRGLSFIALPDDEHRRDRGLQVCNRCCGYLKTIDVPALSAFPLLAIADLETMDLDEAAMRDGYSRPELREFAAERQDGDRRRS